MTNFYENYEEWEKRRDAEAIIEQQRAEEEYARIHQEELALFEAMKKKEIELSEETLNEFLARNSDTAYEVIPTPDGGKLEGKLRPMWRTQIFVSEIVEIGGQKMGWVEDGYNGAKADVVKLGGDALVEYKIDFSFKGDVPVTLYSGIPLRKIEPQTPQQ